jgi:D-3-phosphoglycerate dehydrogenase
MRQGRWEFRLAPPGRLLTGATWGLVGFGRGPRRMVEKLRGFGMTFLAYDPYVAPEVFKSLGVKSASLEEVFRSGDLVSLHCPLTKETYHLIGERELAWLQPQALLVNTSRGSVIDEPALIRALEERRLAGAALDVFEQEPLPPEHPLWTAPNFLMTPHCAGMGPHLEERRVELLVENCRRLARGEELLNVVDKKNWF